MTPEALHLPLQIAQPGTPDSHPLRRYIKNSLKRVAMTEKERTEQDPDGGKGAVEQDAPDQETNTSMAGQLGHRSENPLIKSNDTDYPEPGENPEHSGEPEDGGILKDNRRTA